MARKMSMDDFLGDFTGGGDILDWKEDGKTTIVLHPSSEIASRYRHPFPMIRTKEEEDKKGKVKKVKKLSWIFFNCVCEGEESKNAKCPICRLRAYLRDNDDIDDDDVVLELEVGRDSIQFCKGDILGEDGYDWKKNLNARKEYVFGCVNANNPEKAVVLVGPRTLGKRIKNVIASQIEEVGDEEGNPFTNPYCIKIKYDKAEKGSEMYSADFSQKKITKEIQQVLDADPPDLDPYLSDPDLEDVESAISDAIIISYEGSRVEDPEDDEDKPKKESKKKKKEKKDEDDEDEKPKKKKKKKKKEKEPEPDPEPETENEDEDSDFSCPICSASVGEDDVKCKACGTEFED